jgi:hypothetical protein
MFLYMAIIPFILTRINKDNEPFLKQLAFHLQYGLMSIIGCSITRNPQPPPPTSNDSIENDKESWYEVGDKIFAFHCLFCFIRLHGEN